MTAAGPPSVSVIVPTYNRSHYLRETLTSIAAQTMDDLEVVIVDDGSTDNTSDVLVEAAELFGERMTCIRQPNAGEARAVNTGWAAARGEFVVVVNSDDPQPPDLLGTTVDFMRRNHDVVVGYPDWHRIDAKGARTESRIAPDHDPEALYVLMRCEPGPGATIRRESAARIRGNLRNPAHLMANDLEAWMTIAAFGEIARIPLRVAQWRDHGGSGTSHESAIARQAGRLALAHEFFSRPELPDAVRRFSSRSKANQLRRLLDLALDDRGAGSLAKSIAKATTSDPAEASSALLRRLGTKFAGWTYAAER